MTPESPAAKAAPETEVVPRKATQVVKVGKVDIKLSDDALEALEASGLDRAALNLPEPLAAVSMNAEELCVFPTTHPNASKESPPLILVDLSIDEESSDFANYRGYLVAHVIHPNYGKIAVTHGYKRVEEGGELTVLPLSEFLITNCKPGSVFKVATFETRRGFKVIRPIPVR